MHRFVAGFYRGPVAVNDLGLVAYHNPYFVLDLCGLASEEARVLMANNADAATYERFVRSKGVHLAIIYDGLFGGRIPETWKKVASMDLSRVDLSPASSEVQFYATDSASVAKLHDDLETFKKTLPPRIQLKIY